MYGHNCNYFLICRQSESRPRNIPVQHPILQDQLNTSKTPRNGDNSTQETQPCPLCLIVFRIGNDLQTHLRRVHPPASYASNHLISRQLEQQSASRSKIISIQSVRPPNNEKLPPFQPHGVIPSIDYESHLSSSIITSNGKNLNQNPQLASSSNRRTSGIKHQERISSEEECGTDTEEIMTHGLPPLLADETFFNPLSAAEEVEMDFAVKVMALRFLEEESFQRMIREAVRTFYKNNSHRFGFAMQEFPNLTPIPYTLATEEDEKAMNFAVQTLTPIFLSDKFFIRMIRGSVKKFVKDNESDWGFKENSIV